MDKLRAELERVANVALEACGEEACVAAIERALERVITADDPEPLAIYADEDNRCWSLDALYETVRLELLRLLSNTRVATSGNTERAGRAVLAEAHQRREV